MPDWGLKISEEKRNVFDAEDFNLSYSSEFDTFKVFKRGSGIASVTFDTPTTEVIDHNLGYRPAFLVFSEISDSFGNADEYYLLPFTNPTGGDVSIMPYVDNTQLKIRYGGDQGPDTTTYKYRYVIFYNRAVPPWAA